MKGKRGKRGLNVLNCQLGLTDWPVAEMARLQGPAGAVHVTNGYLVQGGSQVRFHARRGRAS